MKSKFKQIFNFNLDEVLVEFTRGRYIFDSQKFLDKAFDAVTAKIKPKTITVLVRDKYGEVAATLIQQVLQQYK